LTEAQKIVQQEIELEEWGTESQVKVFFCPLHLQSQPSCLMHCKILTLFLVLQLGTRLIELLLDSAFVQSPADQTPESSPDIRPAFKHVLRQPIVENG
jgi:DNA-directed RNA polymerase